MSEQRQIDPQLLEVLVAFLMGTLLTWVLAQINPLSGFWNVTNTLNYYGAVVKTESTLDFFKFGMVDTCLTGFLLAAKWFFRRESK